jgi:hypothetical protein
MKDTKLSDSANHEVTNLLGMTDNYGTTFCKNCSYCIVLKTIRECEWDIFPPIRVDKSTLYTPIEFDCIHYDAR